MLGGDGVRAVWQSGNVGDVGSGHVRVCVLQDLLGQLHIASLYLKQLIDNSGQHGHHPCKQTYNVLLMVLQDLASLSIPSNQSEPAYTQIIIITI